MARVRARTPRCSPLPLSLARSCYTVADPRTRRGRERGREETHTHGERDQERQDITHRGPVVEEVELDDPVLPGLFICLHS